MAVCLSLVVFITTMQFDGTIQVNGVNGETTNLDITVKNEDGTEAVNENNIYFVNCKNPIIEVSNAENIKEIRYSTTDNDSTGEKLSPVENDGKIIPNLVADTLYYIWIIDSQDKAFGSFRILYDTQAPEFSTIDNISMDKIGNVYWTKENKVVIKVTDKENGSGVVLKYSNKLDYQNANETIPYDENEKGYVLTNLIDGNTYYVWSCDKIGNYIKNPIQIKYDCTPPKVEITDINGNKLIEKEKDGKTYWTNQDKVKIHIKNSEEGTITFRMSSEDNFEESNITIPNFLANENCYEFLLGSENNYIWISDAAGNFTKIFVKKKLKVSYVVRKNDEYLVPNGGEGTLYTINAADLTIDVSDEKMNGVGIESVEICEFVENSENNSYIKVIEEDSKYSIKLNKEKIIQVKITDNLGNINIIQLEYTDNDASLVFYDDDGVSIFPDEKNTYYFKNYYFFSLFNYSKKITSINYSIYGDNSNEFTEQIDKVDDTKFSLLNIAEALKQNKNKFYELCFNIHTLGHEKEEKTETYKIVYDSEAPEFTIINTVENQYVNSETKGYIQIKDIIEKSGIPTSKYFISGNQNENPEKFTLSNKGVLEISEIIKKLQDGDNEINFILTDKAGNEKLQSTTIKYDNTAPTFKSEYAHDGEIVGKNTDYAIEIEAYDATSKINDISCIINEGDANKREEYVYSLTDTVEDTVNHTIRIKDILGKLSEGTNTVKIIVTDKAGNQSSIIKDTNQEAEGLQEL